jgi:hypothetical protein
MGAVACEIMARMPVTVRKKSESGRFMASHWAMFRNTFGPIAPNLRMDSQACAARNLSAIAA